MEIERMDCASDRELLHNIAFGNESDAKYSKVLLEYRAYKALKRHNLALLALTVVIALAGLLSVICQR